MTYCGDATGNCEFSEAKSSKEGLPVMVVDEDIYRRPPSLLIATVDKFAQMPWKGETQNLFGNVDGLCLRHGFPVAGNRGRRHRETPGQRNPLPSGTEATATRPVAPARSDHPGRTASHQRAAGLDGRAVRNRGGRDVLRGSLMESGCVRRDYCVDGDHPSLRIRSGAETVLAKAGGFPATGDVD